MPGLVEDLDSFTFATAATPVAVVIPKPHVTEPDSLTTELSSRRGAKLAGYRLPRRFGYRNQFLLGPAGKVLRRQIADELASTARSSP